YGDNAMTEHEHTPPLLFHLGHDPSEKQNIAAEHPDVVARITEIARKHIDGVEPVENQLEKGVDLTKTRKVTTVKLAH
ncbi:MAG TPA: hypothetical protein DD670_00580, partial [Planctomycetaceae bacterium]|nr:hypothetical protein [Planctomycetaceae bacterium]